MQREEYSELYGEDSAGSIMSGDFILLGEAMTVGEATEHLRKTASRRSAIRTLFVTDGEGRLVGSLDPLYLLLYDFSTPISRIFSSPARFVYPDSDKEEAAELISEHDLSAVAVVDPEGRPIGIIGIDDALEVISDGATEDISVMAAVTPSEKSYLESGVLSIFSSRIPWLLLLMLSATFTGIIITSFESALSSLVALTAYIPMLMGTGGNAGAQVSVTVTRAISLGELSFPDALRVVRKELTVALLCGAALGAAGFFKIILFDMLLLGTEGVTLAVAASVALTLLCTVAAAKLTGALLPLAAYRIGLDPAIVAGPAITTVVDIISLLLYFGISKAVLGI